MRYIEAIVNGSRKSPPIEREGSWETLDKKIIDLVSRITPSISIGVPAHEILIGSCAWFDLDTRDGHTVDAWASSVRDRIALCRSSTGRFHVYIRLSRPMGRKEALELLITTMPPKLATMVDRHATSLEPVGRIYLPRTPDGYGIAPAMLLAPLVPFDL